MAGFLDLTNRGRTLSFRIALIIEPQFPLRCVISSTYSSRRWVAIWKASTVTHGSLSSVKAAKLTINAWEFACPKVGETEFNRTRMRMAISELIRARSTSSECVKVLSSYDLSD